MSKKPRAYGENVGKPPISVRHSKLKRFSEESYFKSICPACPDGVLLVRRNEKTFDLEKLDLCVACGQAVLYEDIGKLRAMEGCDVHR